MEQGLNLQGVLPPLTTPFENGRFVPDLLKRNVESYNAVALGGYVVLGSTGEFPHLDTQEKIEAIRAVVEVSAAGRAVIAGTGEMTTWGTIELCKAAAEAGAHAVMVVPPYYFRPHLQGDTLRRFYEEVADGSPLPVLLYNMPAYAGVDIPVEMVQHLSEHPNVIGIKDSSGRLGLLEEYVKAGGPGFAVFAGSASVLLGGLMSGAAGAVTAAADFVPWECADLYQAVQRGDFELARKRQAQIGAAERVVAGKHGPAGVKYAMDLFGYFGLEPRPPLMPLNGEAQNEVRAILMETELMKGY